MDPTDTEKPRTITVKWLRDLGACSDQVKLFAATFPDGAPITVEAALAAARTGLELSWFAERVLDDAALRAYHEALATERRAYREATAPALVAALLSMKETR